MKAPAEHCIIQCTRPVSVDEGRCTPRHHETGSALESVGEGCVAEADMMMASICEHSRKRIQCKKCRGGSICQHSRRRSTCRVRWGWHLPPQSQKEKVQGVRNRGALNSNHIGFCPDSSAFRSPGRFSRAYISLRRRYRIIGSIADRCAPTCSLVDAPVALSDTAASSSHDRHLSATLSFAPDSLMGMAIVFDP